MTTERTIKICGVDVKIIYCAASENGFEDLSGKSIAEIDFSKSKDILHLALACIIAAYLKDDEEPPIKSEDLLYNATSEELTELYTEVAKMRAEWYHVPLPVADTLKKEADEMTEAEKEEAEKNAQPPTTDTQSS